MRRRIVLPVPAVPALVLAVCVALSGCEDNLARRDTITPWSGDDIAANEAIQTINPWPRESFNHSQSTQGSKLEAAMKAYRTTSAQSVVAPSTTDIAPAAGGASAPPAAQSDN